MTHYIHELKSGDRFRFTDRQYDHTELPTDFQEVVACWGVRTPDGKAVAPWMLACRDAAGLVYNFALPPTVGVELAEALRPL